MSHVCNGDVYWGFDVYWYLLYPKDKYLGLDVPHVCRGQMYWAFDVSQCVAWETCLWSLTCYSCVTWETWLHCIC